MALKVEDRVQFNLLRSHQCHTRQQEGDGDQGEAVRVDFEQTGWQEERPSAGGHVVRKQEWGVDLKPALSITP